MGVRWPYGAVGDRLWVREPWRVVLDDGGAFVEYSTGDELGFPDRDDELRAMAEQSNGDRNRHARYMPRWASRFILEITGVRVERVQDISEEDADAEGVSELDGAMDEAAFCAFAGRYHLHLESSRTWFAYLWDSIHGPGAWDRNEWVWVIEFDIVNIDKD